MYPQWSQRGNCYRQKLHSIRYLYSPEFGDMGFHGDPNHARKHVVAKSKIYTLEGLIFQGACHSDVIIVYSYQTNFGIIVPWHSDLLVR